jgi:prepilin-type N-terminal cleavage/methylation domain-containing protein
MRPTLRPGQGGFTLVEILISLAIGGLIVGVLGTFIVQTLRLTTSSNDRLLVTDDLRTAAAWLTQDGQMAHLATSTAVASTLVLSWTDVYSGVNIGYQSTYAVSGSELQRGFGVRGAAPVTITVARHIAAPNGVSFSIGADMLTATITATAGQTTESRTIQVGSRR